MGYCDWEAVRERRSTAVVESTATESRKPSLSDEQMAVTRVQKHHVTSSPLSSVFVLIMRLPTASARLGRHLSLLLAIY